MPLTSAAMIEHLGSNVTSVVPLWKLISRDGLTAAYVAHSRPTPGRLINGAPPFTFGGVTYKPATVQSTRDIHKLGLAPNSTQILGAFDDVLTRVDVENGRWKLAKIVFEYVNYLDLSMGSTGKIVGVAGKWIPMGATYEVEFLSNGHLLSQMIGEATSPTDRNIFPAGLDKAAWTVTRNVVSSSDRRHLVIDGAAQEDHYYKYGVIMWVTGANAATQGMEIKDNVGNNIELQLPMPADIAAGNQVTLLAGYDGTREQLRDKFGAMEDGNMEPDLPGMGILFNYPE